MDVSYGDGLRVQASLFSERWLPCPRRWEREKGKGVGVV